MYSMMHFSKEFLEKYRPANYVAILAASGEPYRTGWIAPDKDKDPREHVSANTAVAAAAAGSGTDTAAREQTAMGEGATNNNSESNQSAPVEHAVPGPDKQHCKVRAAQCQQRAHRANAKTRCTRSV